MLCVPHIILNMACLGAVDIHVVKYMILGHRIDLIDNLEGLVNTGCLYFGLCKDILMSSFRSASSLLLTKKYPKPNCADKSRECLSEE